MNRLQADRDRQDERFLHQEGSSGLAKSTPVRPASAPPVPLPPARTVQIGEEGSDPMPVDAPATVEDSSLPPPEDSSVPPPQDTFVPPPPQDSSVPAKDSSVGPGDASPTDATTE